MTIMIEAPATVKPRAIVHAKQLAKQLGVASKVAPKKSHKPILSFVRFIADPEQGATLEATNLEIGIRLRLLGVRCESRAAMLLPPAGASKLLKSAASEDVVLTDRGGSIAIGDGASVASVAYGGDADEFPTMPDFPHDGPFWRVGADTMRGALARTMPFSDVESTRYALGGVFLDFDPAGPCYIVATDGRRLSQVTIGAEPINPRPNRPIRAVLPIAACKLIETIAKGEECVDVAYVPSEQPDRPHDGHFLFRVGHSGAELYSRSVEGRFPRYQDVLSDHCDVRAGVDVATLHRHAKSCAAVAESLSPDGTSRGFDLSIGAGSVGLTIEGEDAPAFSASAPCDQRGPDRVATLDAYYFLGLLAPLAKSADPIEIRMIDHKNAVEFRSEWIGSDHATFSMRAVIMPLTRDRPAPEAPAPEAPAPADPADLPPTGATVQPPDAGAIEDADRDVAADFGDDLPAPAPLPPTGAADMELSNAIDSALFTARVTAMPWAVVFTPGLNYPYALISIRTLEESPLRMRSQRVRYVADPPRTDDGPPPDDGGQGGPPSPPPADGWDGGHEITIGGRSYRVDSAPNAPGLHAWRLSYGTTEYVAAENPDGRPSCECGDWRMRCADIPSHAHCKHIVALLGHGMLAEWFPTPPPEPESEPMPSGPDPAPHDGRKATADRLRADRNRAADRDGRSDVNRDHLLPMRRDRAEIKEHGRILADAERRAIEADAYRAEVAREEAESSARAVAEIEATMRRDPFYRPAPAELPPVAGGSGDSPPTGATPPASFERAKSTLDRLMGAIPGTKGGSTDGNS